MSAFDIEDITAEEEITEYGKLTHADMWNNLEYFLKAVVPEAEKSGIKLALHPDDPPIDSIRRIPRIMTSVNAFKRLIELVPSSSNGLTFCQGSFASMGGEGEGEGEDIPVAIHTSAKEILFILFIFGMYEATKTTLKKPFMMMGKLICLKPCKPITTSVSEAQSVPTMYRQWQVTVTSTPAIAPSAPCSPLVTFAGSWKE